MAKFEGIEAFEVRSAWFVVEDMSYRSFRELRVWSEAVELAVDISKACNRFPRHERYALADQLRRAAVSIPSNIAEGQARGGDDFRRFLRISLGSLQEVVTQLIIAHRLEYVGSADLAQFEARLTEIERGTRALLKAIGSPPTTNHELRTTNSPSS